MNWYYADQGHRKGPVGQAELDDLVRSGALARSALVWTEGMADWSPYAAIHKPAGPPAALVVSKEHACIYCGNELQPGESVTVGQHTVCAACKPVYVERLREADIHSLPGQLPFADFWIRFTARMADYTLLTIAQAALTVPLLIYTLRAKPKDLSEFSIYGGLSFLTGSALTCVYETVMVSSRGATIGKMLCYLQVVKPNGARLSLENAAGRFFAELMSRFSVGIGYLMAVFDSERRTLHDRVAGTRVIEAPPAGFVEKGLQPVDREIRCGQCQTPFPPDAWNAAVPLPCPGCNTEVQAVVFPAFSRRLPDALSSAKEGEGEAGCYFHDTKRATVACDACGRFLCALCDLDAGVRHLCPLCFNGRFKGAAQTPEFVQRRTLYDTIALAAAVLPNLFLITIYLTIFTAPAVVGFSLWSWKRQSSITPRTRWRYFVALGIAGLNLLFIGILFIALLIGMFK